MSVALLVLEMPPPALTALLPEKVLFVTERVPLLAMPPPAPRRRRPWRCCRRRYCS